MYRFILPVVCTKQPNIWFWHRVGSCKQTNFVSFSLLFRLICSDAVENVFFSLFFFQSVFRFWIVSAKTFIQPQTSEDHIWLVISFSFGNCHIHKWISSQRVRVSCAVRYISWGARRVFFGRCSVFSDSLIHLSFYSTFSWRLPAFHCNSFIFPLESMVVRKI